ncbi:MAG: hypothetical protein HYU36_24425 [Planctomycetes bacterium]|nr:hypothetical protein [Planctomycetota bacterium]
MLHRKHAEVILFNPGDSDSSAWPEAMWVTLKVLLALSLEEEEASVVLSATPAEGAGTAILRCAFSASKQDQSALVVPKSDLLAVFRADSRFIVLAVVRFMHLSKKGGARPAVQIPIPAGSAVRLSEISSALKEEDLFSVAARYPARVRADRVVRSDGSLRLVNSIMEGALARRP